MGSIPTFPAVAVAELVMHQIVALSDAGSNPVGHPRRRTRLRRMKQDGGMRVVFFKV